MTSGLSDGTKRCAIPWPAEKLGVLEELDKSTTPLDALGTWSSKVDDLPETGMISVLCLADVDGYVYMSESNDGVNWRSTSGVGLLAGTFAGFHAQKNTRYSKVVYENDVGAQTSFQIYVYRRYKVISTAEAKFPVK